MTCTPYLSNTDLKQSKKFFVLFYKGEMEDEGISEDLRKTPDRMHLHLSGKNCGLLNIGGAVKPHDVRECRKTCVVPIMVAELDVSRVS